LLAVAVSLIALSLAACSSSEETPSSDGSSSDTQTSNTQEAAVKTVKQDLVENADPNALTFADTEGDCAARASVEALGVPRLQELGMNVETGIAPSRTEPPLTKTEADELYAIYGRCADLKAKVADFLSAGGELAPGAAACVAERYEAAGLLRRSLFGADFDPALNDEIDQTLATATAACT
jgi:hypothetical protein